MSTESVRYVGLDVHKRVVEACIVEQRGKVVHRERFALNRRVLELFAKKILRKSDHVALEATTNCWAVADALRPHVAKVLVSNPMATKAIAQAKVKTDKVDAHVLAQLLRCDFLPEVWQPDEGTQRLRELTGRRSTLVGQRTMMRTGVFEDGNLLSQGEVLGGETEAGYQEGSDQKENHLDDAHGPGPGERRRGRFYSAGGRASSGASP